MNRRPLALVSLLALALFAAGIVAGSGTAVSGVQLIAVFAAYLLVAVLAWVMGVIDAARSDRLVWLLSIFFLTPVMLFLPLLVLYYSLRTRVY